MFLQAIPVLYTDDIFATIRFYESTLGFTAANYGTHAVLKKGGATLQFVLRINNAPVFSSSCYIIVNDVQCLFTQLAAKDIIYPENKLLDLPGGKKKFTIKDNNGILLHFVQES